MPPITKNGSTNYAENGVHILVARGETPIGKNIIVTDEFGNKLAQPYPKRAKGLIKKGRAEQIGENEIRLLSCSVMPCQEDKMNTLNNFTDNNISINPETGEVIEAQGEKISTGADMLHANEPVNVYDKDKGGNSPKLIFFNAREWKPSKDCDKTVASRSFISDPFGRLTEAYTVGNWTWDWSQIETKDMTLEKNTDYEFTFWLNGGENDRNDETCRFEIMFDNDYENRYVYNLNRNFIRYRKYYKGWYLYVIPFNTGDSCYTKFRFISTRTYSTLMRAEPLEKYADLPEDKPIEGLPQRHNIIFSEGYPRNSWWSSQVFPQENGQSGSDNNSSQNNVFGDIASKSIASAFGFDDEKMASIGEEIKQRIQEELEDEFDADYLADELMANIDIGEIKEQIIQQIKDNLS